MTDARRSPDVLDAWPLPSPASTRSVVRPSRRGGCSWSAMPLHSLPSASRSAMPSGSLRGCPVRRAALSSLPPGCKARTSSSGPFSGSGSVAARYSARTRLPLRRARTASFVGWRMMRCYRARRSSARWRRLRRLRIGGRCMLIRWFLTRPARSISRLRRRWIPTVSDWPACDGHGSVLRIPGSSRWRRVPLTAVTTWLLFGPADDAGGAPWRGRDAYCSLQTVIRTAAVLGWRVRLGDDVYEDDVVTKRVLFRFVPELPAGCRLAPCPMLGDALVVRGPGRLPAPIRDRRRGTGADDFVERDRALLPVRGLAPGCPGSLPPLRRGAAGSLIRRSSPRLSVVTLRRCSLSSASVSSTRTSALPFATIFASSVWTLTATSTWTCRLRRSRVSGIRRFDYLPLRPDAQSGAAYCASMAPGSSTRSSFASAIRRTPLIRNFSTVSSDRTCRQPAACGEPPGPVTSRSFSVGPRSPAVVVGGRGPRGLQPRPSPASWPAVRSDRAPAPRRRRLQRRWRSRLPPSASRR